MKALIFSLLLLPFWAFAQEIPQNPNKTDKKGLRQGKWTIAYNKEWQVSDNQDSIMYYRLIEYKNDKPVGIVKDYYLSGTLQMEGHLLTDRPEEIMDGGITWYREDGTTDVIRTFDKGNQKTEIFFNEDGSLKTETVQTLAEQMRPYLGLLNPTIDTTANNLKNMKWDKLFEVGQILMHKLKYEEAKKYLKQAKIQAEKEFGALSQHYVNTCSLLANVYQDQAIYNEAEALYLEAKNTTEKFESKESQTYAFRCLNLASFYMDLGFYIQAEPLIVEGKDILEKINGKHIYYATACHMLGFFYYQQGFYSRADTMLIEAKSIIEEILGNEHASYANICSTLASVYRTQGVYTQTEKMLIEAKAIREKVFGKQHTDYAYSSTELATLYRDQGLYTKAELLLLEAKAIYEKILSKVHPIYANSCNDLALLYENQGFYHLAEPLYREASEVLILQTKHNFYTLSEKEKAQFLATFYTQFICYQSFVLKAYAQSPTLTSWLYDNTLATKALIFQSGNKIRETILSSGDSLLIYQYQDWKTQKDYLNKVATLSLIEKEKQGLDEKVLEAQANTLEKELASKSAVFAKATDKTRYKWQDIQRNLRAKEAAIEIIRICYYDKKWTDSVFYVALIIRPETQSQPELVVLSNGNDMEKKYLDYYKNKLKSESDHYSYSQYWERIQNKLMGIEKVYVSVDGVYNSISLATLYNPITEKYLLEVLDIQILSNTKDLIQYRSHLEKPVPDYSQYRLVLIGYPAYADLPTHSMEKDNNHFLLPSALINAAKESTDSTLSRFFDRSSGTVKLLPGTKDEVEYIAELAKSQNIDHTVYLNQDASEENLKKVSNPDILLVATHGYFLSDQVLTTNRSTVLEKINLEGLGSFSNGQLAADPLLRSGLLLKGAQQTLRGEKVTGEDGILTAKEAQNLTLDHTDLVILSACETGLGIVKNGEGVYGLQRTFQQAGARTILMSLWTVNDESTALLMRTFYNNLLIKHQPKRIAFQNAQLTVKADYPEPYYWGAFVMMGE